MIGELAMEEAQREPLAFFVPGQAVPKGSLTMYSGRMVESAKGWPAWKEIVADHAWAARRQHDYPIFIGPVGLVITFYLRRPQRPKDEQHVTKPDLDKLVRGICDALTGVLYMDDAQVNWLAASKHYAITEPEVFIQFASSN
jgi:crossover junction endodeoxyribonuclease RusA